MRAVFDDRELDRRIAGELDRLQAEALELFEASGTRAIHRSVFEAGGKLLRPRVLLLSAALGSPDWSLARRAALAIELLHVGTLYHDDLVDRSPTRRGEPAVHCRLGAEVAALGGAHLLCLANALACGLPDPVAARWGRALLRVADGQLRETETAGCFELTPQGYERIARLKTASLFELAAGAGGYLAGLPSTERETLHKFGLELGMAFQLTDDLEDLVARPDEHRAPATDLREHIWTLPVLHACSARGAAGARLRELLREDGRPLSEAAIEEAVRLLVETGGVRAGAERALAYAERADARLVDLPESAAREALSRLVREIRPPELAPPPGALRPARLEAS